ncbi:ATP-binding protein [Enterococcus faecalis]|uniref:ATP-binding protein n=1 Tax=Enterococcus faecalis TaxID=1351 RepID=UPI0019678913|nr:ATP-binding protein [Enterococcus faecalis]MBN3024539.1 ATP-binding protein [Enterococcus faecalis]MBO6313376.1 ATP-binding protein [Enterococcus faecalis]
MNPLNVFKKEVEKPKKFEYPVLTYRTNLILTPSSDVWAYYKVFSTDLNLQDTEKVDTVKDEFTHTIDEIGKKYKGIDISLYPMDLGLEEQFEELAPDFNKETPDISAYYVEEMMRRITSIYGKLTRPKFIIGVKIREYNQVTSRFESIKGGAEEVKETIYSVLGGSSKDKEAELKRFEGKEEELYQELSSIKAERMSEEEMAYLLKFNILRNTKHERDEEERVQTLSELTEAILTPNERRGVLGIETEYGKQYASFLPISKLPDYALHSRLFYRAQSFPFPTEFHVKGRSRPADGFLGVRSTVTNKRKNFKVDAKETMAVGDSASLNLAKNMKKSEMILEDLEEEITIFEWLGCFVVYGDTAKQCLERARALRKYFRKLDVRVEIVVSDQIQLFYTLLQGEGKGSKYWKQTTNSYALSEFLFGITNEIGNRTGYPIGVQTEGNKAINREKAVKQSRKLVRLNLAAANQNIQGSATAAPHIHVTGITGSGKSYLMLLMFYISNLFNIQSLYFDPKVKLVQMRDILLQDKSFIEKYPYFAKMWNNFRFITLSIKDKSNYGVLDPLVFLPENEAREVAEGILYQIYDLDKNDLIRLEALDMLNQLVEERQQGKKVGMQHLIDRLLEHEELEVRRFAKILQQEVKNSLLELAFSDGTGEGIKFDKRSVILSVEGLSLPKPDKSPQYYEKHERKSLAIMLCVGKYIELFGKIDEKAYTYEFFDEAWTLTRSAIGKEIINKIKKVGRSQCNACVFGTQSVADIHTEDTKGQVGMLFAFDEDSEREDILREVGLEVNPKNIDLLKNLKQGQCIMRDMYQRTGKLTVYSWFEEWTIANQTVDRTASGNVEEKYAS